MTQYDNTNRGTLFKNTRKKGDKHPDFTGKINVNGEDYDLSAWVKQGRNGEFYSLSVRPPYKADDRKDDDIGGSDFPF